MRVFSHHFDPSMSAGLKAPPAYLNFQPLVFYLDCNVNCALSKDNAKNNPSKDLLSLSSIIF